MHDPGRWPYLLALLLGACACWCLLFGIVSVLASPPASYSVAIDGQDTGLTIPLQVQGARLLISRADALRLGLAAAADPFDLAAADLRLRIDPEARRLDLYRRAARNGNGNGNGHGNGNGNGGGNGNGADGARPVILDVSVNGRSVQRNVRALRTNGLFLFEPADVAGWRVTADALPPMTHRGRSLAAAGTGTGVVAVLDRQQQAVDLRISAEARARQEVRGDGHAVRPAPPPAPSTGAFLNYDAYVQADRTGRFASQLLEGGVFSPLGVLLTTVLGHQGDDRSHAVRLETAFIHDDPEARRTLRIGDAISVPGDWSRPVRFGGIQIGRNFALDPGFIPYPLPSFAGQAAVPSTLDVFINGALNHRGRVDDGPFTLSRIPVMQGGGTANLVVRDVLGREQVLSLPFYISTRLLQAGLDAWSMEAGFLRNRFQERSFDYGQFLAQGTYRYGVTDRLTVEGHGEAGIDRQAAGASVAWLWPQLGEFNLSLAATLDEGRTGALAGIGFQRIFPDFSFSLRHTERTPGFREIGGDNRGDAHRIQVRSETQVTASLPMGSLGTASGTVARQILDGADDVLVASVNYSVPIGADIQLGLFALHTVSGRAATTVGFNLSIPLGPRDSVQVGGRSGTDGATATADYSRPTPVEGGLGLRARVQRGRQQETIEGTAEWDGTVGRFSAGAARHGGRPAVFGSASGALVLADGGLFASRRIDEGFAVVTVPDQPDVRIYRENNLVGRTDADGQLLVTRLHPYMANQIGVDPADLPIRARLDQRRIEVAPGYRSGTVVRFPVEGLDTVLVRLLRDGKPVAPGTRVANLDTGQAARVAQDGEALLRVPAADSRFSLDDGNGGCAFTVPPFDRAQPGIPRLTVEACR